MYERLHERLSGVKSIFIFDGIKRKCVICGNKYYAKGLCKKHHAIKLRTGSAIGVREKSKLLECIICGNRVGNNGKYCSRHWAIRQRRIKNDIPHDDNILDNNMSGYNKNPQYKNHHIMKQNRLLKIKMVNGKCEICGCEGKEIHHKDKTKTNHSLDNLIFVCIKCHRSFHKKLTKP